MTDARAALVPGRWASRCLVFAAAARRLGRGAVIKRNSRK